MTSKRACAIDRMRIAGYHDDRRAFTRLLVESRVSSEVANDAFRRGVAARNSGVACTCLECRSTEQ